MSSDRAAARKEEARLVQAWKNRMRVLIRFYLESFIEAIEIGDKFDVANILEYSVYTVNAEDLETIGLTPKQIREWFDQCTSSAEINDVNRLNRFKLGRKAERQAIDELLAEAEIAPIVARYGRVYVETERCDECGANRLMFIREDKPAKGSTQMLELEFEQTCGWCRDDDGTPHRIALVRTVEASEGVPKKNKRLGRHLEYTVEARCDRCDRPAYLVHRRKLEE